MAKRIKVDCAEKLKVLADAVRITVLELLMQGPKHVWELNEKLGIEQSLLSHHLKVLRREALVESVRNGKSVLYRLANQGRNPDKDSLELGCCRLKFSRSKV